jgi:class 3 adenylate cyclase/predicted ATPase
MLDVARWLAEQGLGHHAEAFAENGIAGDVLRDLTDADLRELGLNLGDRKRLLKAIAALAAGSTDARAETPEPTAEPAVPREAERRQLTVLFCDLVGSTALSAGLDPEEMREVIRGYQNAVAGEIARFDGHIAKYMGDGVLAYFGWPRAHEDEAERAVRAGLAITGSVARLEGGGARLACRVGIATGLVVVGDLVGQGAAQEEAVVGETPNLAARLQGLAGPSTVVIGQETARLISSLFVLEDLCPQDLKGFGQPVPAFHVVDEVPVESRFAARAGPHLTTLVGRAHELGLLLERWDRAKEGEGQAVLLMGEAGIGKSRLARALRERLANEPHIVLPHDGSPFHTSSTLHPVVRLLERAAGFVPGDAQQSRLEKLEALLRRGAEELEEALPLVAALLGLEAAPPAPVLDLTPERRKQRTLEVLVDQVAGLARHQPVLALYEDAHWLDPTTLEAISLLIGRLERLPVLVLVTHRPEFTAPWTGPHVSRLSLARLGRRDGSALALDVSGGKALPDAVLSAIIERTDGVPLFIEELTKAVLESGLLREAHREWLLEGPLPPLAIPTTLHGSLMARLDRLTPVKKVAQTAAVIGREFAYDLLAAVVPLAEAGLDAALEQLVAADLIFPRGPQPAASYMFKHALVQEAAYHSLLRSRRAWLHAKVAAAIERDQPDKAQLEPELLAHHLTEAGDTTRAIDCWRAAGQRASERSAFHEAVANLRKSIELLRGLPETEERDRKELGAQIDLGSAYVVIQGYASAAAETAYARARELARRLEEPARLFTSTWGLWLINQTRVDVSAGRALAEELLAVAERGADLGRRLEAHHAAWTTLLCVPDLAMCCRHTEQGLALYDPDQHVAHKFQYGGHDPGVCAMQTRGIALWLSGYPERARTMVGEAMRLARHLGHGPSLIVALSLSSYLYRFRGEIEAVRERSEEQIRLCAEQGIAPQHAAWARLGRAWSLVQVGELEVGLAEMREGIDQLEAMKIRYRRAYHLAMFAETCMKAGSWNESQAALSDALESAERWWEPEVHRLRGDLALVMDAGAHQEAEHHFQQALSVARAQESRSLELRAATSLTFLWAKTGDRQRARDLLASIYGWFTEGFDTADLKDAKALLDERA